MDNAFDKYTERYDVESFNKPHINYGKYQYLDKCKDEDIIFSNVDEHSTKIYEITKSVVGNVGYMCPNCFNVQHIQTHEAQQISLLFEHVTDDEISEIESNNIELSVEYSLRSKCSVCRYNKSHIILDDNIADAIGILNIKGYFTVGSSEGHKYISSGTTDPYIEFDKFKDYYSNKTVTDIENYIENTLPLSWYIDRPVYAYSYSYKTSNTSIAKKFVPKNKNHLVIKSDYFNKEEALRDILKWARSLKDLKEPLENMKECED